jgi:DNA-binding helix-hairpin-helix protein with protein kinase domain
MDLHNENGEVVRLARPLTRAGGEGQVYEIEGAPTLVAKLYHQPADTLKATKLRHQIKLAQAPLRSIAAWPTDLLFDPVGHKKTVRGIVMPRMPGKEIHKLYGPGDRAAEFPAAGWDFLIHVAMNCAAAFETLHEHGAVMADVNEGNVLVKEADGRVGLIDCDSYQIQNGSVPFLCDVGIPMWTPPELQGQNFRGLARTPNHDRFGLAVIIFRLLFMGRHPFAGIPTGKDQFEIEEAIKRCLFAFSPNVWSRGVKQPPFSLPLAAIPEPLRQLFERAFLPGSMQPNARPTGREWALALKALLASVKKGCIDPGHKYWNGLTSCPWCEITNGGGPNFFISVAIHVGSADWTADFNKFWAAIERVMHGTLMHEKVAVPSIGRPQGKPMPLARPQAPSLRAPVMPSKPTPVARMVPQAPQLPPKPTLRPPVVLPKMPMGPSESMARLCGLGAGFFAMFAVFCQTVGVEVAKYGAAWAFAACAVVCLVKWSPARRERNERREVEQRARLEDRRAAEAELAKRLEAFEAQVTMLMKQHAVEVAKADAEHQRLWLERDQAYQKEFNAYLAAQREYDAAQNKHAEAVRQWNAEVEQREQLEAQLRGGLNAAVASLEARLADYQTQVRTAYPGLDAARQRFEKARADELAEMRALNNKRQELQLRQFLAKQLIRDADIPNIGSGRKATLAAYNICTALDVQWNMQVPGFKDVLLGNLYSWRRWCEGQFRYNASVPLPTAEVNAVKVKFAQARQMALAELRGGAAKLESLESKARVASSQGKMEILNLARAHAQAIADLAVCS